MKHGAKRTKWVMHLSHTWVTVAGAFALSLLAFGFVLLLPFISERMAPDAIPEEVLGERGIERSVWVVFHDGEILTGLVKVTSDTRTMMMRATGYPPQTEIVEDTTVTTAAALYPTRGEQVALLIDDLPILSIPISGAAVLIGRVSGNLSLTLSQTVGTLSAGAQTLTPLQAAAVLKFDGWEQGGVGQAWAHAELTAAFLNRALTDKIDLQTAFGELTTVCDTNLNISQFEAVRGGLMALSVSNKGTLCEARVVSGYMTGTSENRRYVCG